MADLHKYEGKVYEQTTVKLLFSKVNELEKIMHETGFQPDESYESKGMGGAQSYSQKEHLKITRHQEAGDPPFFCFEPTDGKWDEMAKRLDELGFTKLLFPDYEIGKKPHPLIRSYS